MKITDVQSEHDITFSHNANFFLYTTLESARPIAPLRGTSVPAPFPVLTGTPVAGMAYLDRPVPAGYFIFPDLSVRHEGKYRLSFNLFEELKEEKDTDVPAQTTNLDHPNSNLLRGSPMTPHSHVHFRLEVKSEPFVVYSAKKFPGLAESTSLSRVVAEQGCRVRIRRDVRMRRRENKPSKDFDEYDEEANAYRNSDRFTTPDNYNQAVAMERARSVSASSVDGNIHQYPAVDRRTSTHDSGFYSQASFQQQQQPQQPPQLAAPVPQQPMNFNSHLTFGSATQYVAPTMPNNIQQQMPPSFQSFHQQPPPPPPSQPLPHQQQQPSAHSRHASNASLHDFTAQQSFQPQQPQFSTPQPPMPQPTMTQHRIPQPRDTNMFPTVDTKFSCPTVDTKFTCGPTQQYYYPTPSSTMDLRSSTPSSNPTFLPPLKPLQPLADQRNLVSSPLTASSPAVGYDGSATSYGFPQPQMTNTSTSKRSYDRGFDTTHMTSSLTNGARPQAISVDVVGIETDDGEYIDPEDQFGQKKVLEYRRADGSKSKKKISSPL